MSLLIIFININLYIFLLSSCTFHKFLPNIDAVVLSNKIQEFKHAQNTNVLNFFKPYKIDIQQGNLISHEMVIQLKKNMTKNQVHLILGTPLLVDLFHINRWNYQCYLIKNNGTLLNYQLSIFFKNNLLDYYESNRALPTEQEYYSLIN